MIENDNGEPMTKEDLQFLADERRRGFDCTIGNTEELWDLEYNDGRGCENQSNAILNLIAMHLDRIATELEILNKSREVEQRTRIDVVAETTEK